MLSLSDVGSATVTCGTSATPCAVQIDPADIYAITGGLALLLFLVAAVLLLQLRTGS